MTPLATRSAALSVGARQPFQDRIPVGAVFRAAEPSELLSDGTGSEYNGKLSEATQQGIFLSSDVTARERDSLSRTVLE